MGFLNTDFKGHDPKQLKLHLLESPILLRIVYKYALNLRRINELRKMTN